MQILATTYWAVFLFPMSRRVHNEDFELAAIIQDSKCMTVSAPLFAWAITTTKCSVALTLRRLRDNQLWRLLLTTMLALQLVYGVTLTLWTLLQCRPLRATWDPLIEHACASPQHIALVIYTTGGITIGTDFIFSILPLTFILQLHRPARDKALIVALMAMGLLTSAVCFYRIHLISGAAARAALHDPDALQWSFAATLWACVESQLTVIAVALPHTRLPLKRLFAGARLHEGVTFWPRRPAPGRKEEEEEFGEGTLPTVISRDWSYE